MYSWPQNSKQICHGLKYTIFDKLIIVIIAKLSYQLSLETVLLNRQEYRSFFLMNTQFFRKICNIRNIKRMTLIKRKLHAHNES